MRLSLLSGIVADQLAEFRTSYPINLEPIAVSNQISAGQLRMTAGSTPIATGPGTDRGGIWYNNAMYRVMGSKLIRLNSDFTIDTLGDVGTDGLPVTLDYSFDRLGIRSGANLYYWDGTNLTQVTTPDLGQCLDFIWIDGYFMSTDGTNVVTTELTDPTTILGLHYGSAEEDPDPVSGLIKVRDEAYVCGTNTIQIFRNIGGDTFPFTTLIGATIPYGVVGPLAKCRYADSFAFVGSTRNEALRVYIAGMGDASPISNRLIEDELAAVSDPTSIILENRTSRGEQRLFVHLPTKSLVFLRAASTMLQTPVWYVAQSGFGAPYRQRFAVEGYGQVIVGDLNSAQLATLTDAHTAQFGEEPAWQFDVGLVYNGAKGGIVHSVELVGLQGRAPYGINAKAFMSMSRDGVNFTTERPRPMGLAGQNNRLQWRPRSSFRNYLGFRFRGTGGGLPGFAACEANLSPLAI